MNEPPSEDDDDVVVPPKVIDAPERIWLNVGDIERDCTFDELSSNEVSWCWHQVDQADVAYIRADTVPALITAAVERERVECAQDAYTLLSHGIWVGNEKANVMRDAIRARNRTQEQPA